MLLMRTSRVLALLTAALVLYCLPLSAQLITEYPVPTTTSRPSQIVAGFDGQLWFTEGAGNKIGSISTDGGIAEFALWSARSGPEDIV